MGSANRSLYVRCKVAQPQLLSQCVGETLALVAPENPAHGSVNSLLIDLPLLL